MILINLEKIIANNKGLSLKALGLITYISINHPYLEGVNKKILQKELSIGKDAFSSAFNELVKADIILLTGTSIPGKFRYTYELNELYNEI